MTRRQRHIIDRKAKLKKSRGRTGKINHLTERKREIEKKRHNTRRRYNRNTKMTNFPIT